jgi:small-conductance mechanosensitive channel
MFDILISTLQEALVSLSIGVALFLPKLVIAIIIFAIGWILGALIGKLVAQIFRSAKIDRVLQNAGVEDVVKRAGYNLDSGAFVGALVKWFIIIVALVVSFDVLNLTQVNFFLQSVLLYIPNVIVAVLILLAAGVISEVLHNIVVGSARAINLTSANFVGKVTRWAIWIFAILAALDQLRIAEQFVSTLYLGAIVALSLSFGLAFGLGGQNAASNVIERVRQQLTERR